MTSDDFVWPSWEEAERAQRRSAAAMPLRDKLAWLEEAQILVENLQRSRRERHGQVKDTPREEP